MESIQQLLELVSEFSQTAEYTITYYTIIVTHNCKSIYKINCTNQL